MTEKPDIVARLRAYTRNNSPVLASDLKEAADEIASLRSLLTTEPASLIAFARRVSEQIGHAFDPHKNISSVWTAVGDVRRERDALCSEVDLLRKSVAIADDRSRQMVEFVRLVSEAAGRPTPDAFDPPALVHLVEAIRTVRRERDELTPSWVDDAESSAPVYRYLDDHLKPKALTLDDLDRRIAELESSVRRTERRLDAAHAAMHDISGVQDPCARLIVRALDRTLARGPGNV